MTKRILVVEDQDDLRGLWLAGYLHVEKGVDAWFEAKTIDEGRGQQSRHGGRHLHPDGVLARLPGLALQHRGYL